MNLTVNTTDLAQELRLLNQAVPDKSSLPILLNVLFRADSSGLRLAATDTELAFATSCRAAVEEPGVVTLPAKRLLDLVEQLPDATMQVVTDGPRIHLSCNGFRGRLQALPPDDFPAFPAGEGEEVVLGTAALQGMVSRVRYALSDKTKHTLNGALFTLNNGVAAFVATDGKRLVVTTMAKGAGPACSAVVPAKALDALLAMFAGGELTFSKGARHLFFKAGPRLLASRMLEGAFPAYERIIPRENHRKAYVDRAALAAALRRVGSLSEENQACYLSFDAEGILLHASSAEAGEGQERVPARFEGEWEALRVCCSWRFLLDFLEVAEASVIEVAVKDATSPLLLTDGANHLAVVMVMRF